MKNAFLKNLLLGILLAGFVFFTTGCKEDENRELPTRGSAIVAYAEDLAPIMIKERAEFERLYPKAHITPMMTSSREAVALLLNDSVHVIVIGRNFNNVEQSIIDKYKLEVDSIKVAYDGIVVLVNKRNPVQRLTSEQLAAILSGSARKWKDVGAGGDASQIVMAFGGKNSSLRDYCIGRFIAGHTLGTSIAPCTSTEEAITYVQKEPSAVGFVTTSWVRIDSLPVGTKLLTIGDPKFQRDSTVKELEYFSPHPYYLYRNYYPMRREIFMISRNAGMGVGTGFIAFVAGAEGQRIITSSGLLPATMPVRFTSSQSQ